MPTTGKNTALKAITLDHPINKRITLELANVDPDLAAAWLGDNHGNRNQRPRAVAAYSRDILTSPRWSNLPPRWKATTSNPCPRSPTRS